MNTGINRVASCGLRFSDKCKLFFGSLVVKAVAWGNATFPFSARVTIDGKRGALIHFTGTVDEMLALGEIFLDRAYKPSMSLTSIADLGANIGIASVWFALQYPSATITAYEANPNLIPFLKENVEHLGVRVENRAVSDTSESVTFYLAPRSFSSSLQSKKNSTPVTVQGVTLSDIHADFLKMDIEGAEFHTAHLARAKEIVGEIHGQNTADIEKLRAALSHYDCSFTTPKGIFRAIFRN